MGLNQEEQCYDCVVERAGHTTENGSTADGDDDEHDDDDDDEDDDDAAAVP